MLSKYRAEFLKQGIQPQKLEIAIKNKHITVGISGVPQKYLDNALTKQIVVDDSF